MGTPRLNRALLLVGIAGVAVGLPVGLAFGRVADLPWFLAGAALVAGVGIVERRRPDQPVLTWFAAMAASAVVVQVLDSALAILGEREADAATLAWTNAAYLAVLAAAVLSITNLLARFPDGKLERRWERLTLQALPVVLVVPGLALVGPADVPLPPYHGTPAVANPFQLSGPAFLAPVASAAVVMMQAVFIVGAVLLVLRYRRSDETRRRQIRWLLLPALFVAFTGVIDLFVDQPELLIHVLWITSMLALPVAITLPLLGLARLDVDRVLRGSLVHGALWTGIAAIYVAVGSLFGLAAGERVSIGWAITLTVLATLLFQPARARLETLADRWVFGPRTDPAHLVAKLGATLAGTFDLAALLPRMATTLEQGLGLQWARVRLAPAPPLDDEPALSVPIVLGEETVGVVECGPRKNGPLTDEDRAVVATLARQAALAVHNVRLATELAGRTRELAASRARLVRAQEVERRRIERNIHDGVQQDLVALISQAAFVRSLLATDPTSVDPALEELQAGLRRVLHELRDLAHGIHPSVLSDRGLLDAVEALAARSTVPVAVRADPSLRDVRLAQEVEGAGYFTVAESLANVLKHASATGADVTLSRSNGSLRIEVCDDGVGFDVTALPGGGLATLRERLAALDGHLEVSSTPGQGTRVAADLAITAPETTP